MRRPTTQLAAIALAAGFALWQAVAAVGYAPPALLASLRGDGPEALAGAGLESGSVEVDYGRVAVAAVALVLAAVIAEALRGSRDA